MISGFVEDDSLPANELFALQTKRPVYTFRRQGKPITHIDSQKQMAWLEPLKLGKRRFRETGAGTNDRAIFAGVADTLEHKLQSGVTRRIGLSTRFRVTRRGRGGATLCIRWHHEPRLEALCRYCQVKAAYSRRKLIRWSWFLVNFQNENRGHLATVGSSLCQRVQEKEENIAPKKRFRFPAN